MNPPNVSVTNTDIDASMISINDVSRAEGNSGSANLTFNVTLSVPSTQTVTVNYTTGGGTATAGTDYTTSAGTVTFTPGDTSEPINVPILGDQIDELNETFNVTLSGPSNAAISDGLGVGTITDDDDPPTISINDVSVGEGDTGTTNANFTVSLSGPSGLTVTVNYATSNGTATAGSDYTAISSTQLTFTPGVTSQPVAVSVQGDALDELDETFDVNLSGASNGTITDATGVGTITDDDPEPSLSIDDVSVTEGDTGAASLNFTVTLSAASGKTVTVDYATANGTATAGSDYTAVGTTQLSFTPGSMTRPVTVIVAGDYIDEGASETMTVNLSNPGNATIADASGTGTITDNDDAGFTLTETNGGTIVEEQGGTTTVDTIMVVLDSEPTSNVVLSIVSAVTTEVTIGTPTLTFTPTGGGTPWNVPQAAVINGGASGVDDGNKMTDVTFSIVDGSSDDTFDPVLDQIITVTTVDIDPP